MLAGCPVVTQSRRQARAVAPQSLRFTCSVWVLKGFLSFLPEEPAASQKSLPLEK